MQGETLTYQTWRWVVLGALFWWFAGLNLFIFHFTAFFLFMGMIYMSNRSSGPTYVPPSSGFIFFIAVFYFLSIVVHSLFVGADGQRIVAAFYNLSFWIMGFMLVMALANAFNSFSVMPLLETFRRLSWITALMAVAMLALWKTGRKEVIIETPLFFLTRFIGETQLVVSSLEARPLLWDWFASSQLPRFNIFSPYPTAAGAILIIIMVLLVTHATIERKTRSPIFWGLLAVNGLGLVMTLSRMSILAFGFSFLAVFLLQKKNVTIWMFVLFSVFLMTIPLLQQLLEYMLSLREGSNSIRMQIYLYSLEQLQGPDWIFGYGVKPREESLIFPLGSHSTYISMLFKCGIFGLVTLIGFQVSLFWRWYRLKARAARKRRDFLFWRGLGWIFIALGLWLFTEDIDAPQMLSFLYFSLIGIFEGFRRRLLYS